MRLLNCAQRCANVFAVMQIRAVLTLINAMHLLRHLLKNCTEHLCVRCASSACRGLPFSPCSGNSCKTTAVSGEIPNAVF